MKRVCIDPGHGGRDPGAVGNGLQEKDLTLRIATEVSHILRAAGIAVLQTRTTDVAVELTERAKKANEYKADAFVSIHINSAENTSARGYETFGYTKTEPLVVAIHSSIIAGNVFSADRGCKQAQFAVLRHTSMPAALVELGFLSNKEDAKLVSTSVERLGRLLADGIMDYLEIPKPRTTTTDTSVPTSNRKAIASGIFADGNGDGLLDNPKDPLTREQFAAVLDRLGLLD